MTKNRHIDFFYAPRTRSSAVFSLLEELRADYTLHLLNLAKNEHKRADYLAINPMGKVPTIRHGDSIVTEQAAIFIYLADLYADKGLAPAIDDPLRGPYLRWTIFYGSCFEPAIVDKSLDREPARTSTSPYGTYDTMLGTLLSQLAKGPYILGERFTAADILWGTALRWTTMFGLVPKLPVIEGFIERIMARPIVANVKAKEEELAASLEAQAS